ncbi:MAG: hypothetical protein ACR2K4_00235 [Candidatus Limnocylindria bacterium]
MTSSRLASSRLRGALSAVLASGLAVAACSTAETPTASAPASTLPSSSVTVSPTPAPTPTPTPAPTPKFTNDADPDLAALIPTVAGGAPVVVAPFDEFALTPGDIGAAFGEIGNRFTSLALAYVEQPRLTLYAMRVDGDPVTTDDLEPHLATAGRYVGIAGLDPDPWEAGAVGGNRVWVRPEDNATAAGTQVYTWASGDMVFLLIGVDDAVNRAMIEALPGEPAPTASPSPSPRSSTAPSTSP